MHRSGARLAHGRVAVEHERGVEAQHLFDLPALAEVGDTDPHHLPHRTPRVTVLVADDVAHETDDEFPRRVVRLGGLGVPRRHHLPHGSVHRVVEQIRQEPAPPPTSVYARGTPFSFLFCFL